MRKNPLLFAYVFAAIVMFGTASYSAFAQAATSVNYMDVLIPCLIKNNGCVAIAFAIIMFLQFLQKKFEAKEVE